MGNDKKSDSLSGVDRALKYQLEFLKLEFEAINQAIHRIDETTQGTKNWAVLVWAGSLGIGLGNTELRRYTIVTAAIPLLFWFIDAQWRRIQRSFIFRIRKISEFLNGTGLHESMRQGRLSGFSVVDPRAQNDRDTEDYRKFTSLLSTLRYKRSALSTWASPPLVDSPPSSWDPNVRDESFRVQHP